MIISSMFFSLFSTYFLQVHYWPISYKYKLSVRRRTAITPVFIGFWAFLSAMMTNAPPGEMQGVGWFRHAPIKKRLLLCFGLLFFVSKNNPQYQSEGQSPRCFSSSTAQRFPVPSPARNFKSLSDILRNLSLVASLSICLPWFGSHPSAQPLSIHFPK